MMQRIIDQISGISEQKCEILQEICEIAEKIKKNYLPIHHEMANNIVAQSIESAQQCQDFLNKAVSFADTQPGKACEKLDEADRLQRRMQRLKYDLILFNQQSATIAKRAQDLKKRIENISINSLATELRVLTEIAPPEAGILAINLEKIEIMRKEAGVLLEEIEKTLLPAQNFDAAKAKLQAVRSMTEKMEKNVKTPRKILCEFMAAKTNIVNLKKELADKTEDAKRLIQENNAGDGQKNLLIEAGKKKAEAEQAEKSDIVNWLTVSSLLIQAISFIETLRNKINYNIYMADHRR